MLLGSFNAIGVHLFDYSNTPATKHSKTIVRLISLIPLGSLKSCGRGYINIIEMYSDYGPYWQAEISYVPQIGNIEIYEREYVTFTDAIYDSLSLGLSILTDKIDENRQRLD